MPKLRALFTLLLVLALLPWAAVANPARIAVAAPAIAVAVVDAPQLCQPAETGQGPAKAAALQDQHRCKGPALPGTACNPLPGLVPALTTLPQPQPQPRARLAGAAQPSGRQAAPDLGPPRRC